MIFSSGFSRAAANLENRPQTTTVNIADNKNSHQNIPVSGYVLDVNNNPLIGVTVLEQGTQKGTMTNAQGYFSIRAELGTVLEFSYIGFKKNTLTIVNSSEIKVIMEEDSRLMDEVVVIGYGTTTRKSVIGSVDQVTSKVIENRPVANLTQALQGTSPSLIIQQRNFNPNSDGGLNINIRGLTTMNNNSPLIVIDGLVSDDASLNKLNPADIDNISILKDAGTAAIYGSRAASGVLLVTTKKGVKNQRPTIHVGSQFGMQDPKILVTPVKGYQNALLKNLSLTNSGSTPAFSPGEVRDLANNEDSEWVMDQIIKSAQQQTHNVSVSGGGEHSTYMVSSGFFKQGSNYIGPNYNIERYNLRSNLVSEYGRFKLTSILAYTRNNSKQSVGDPIGDAMRIPTYYYYRSQADNGKYLLNDVLTESNPVAILKDGGYVKNDNDYINLNLGLDFRIMDGLKLRGVFGSDIFSDHSYTRRMEIPYYLREDDSLPKMYANATRPTEDWNKKAYLLNSQMLLDYDKSFGKHHVTGLIGVTNESYTSASNSIKLEYTDPDLGTPTTGTVYVTSSSVTPQNTTKTSINSILGRLGYSFEDKYFAEFSFREDGSSKFSKNNRWGFFPSASLGWRLTEEAFLTSYKENIGDLKLRGSYGILGNQRISDYQYWTVYAVYNNVYGYNNQSVSGAGFTYGNSELTWEKTATFNLGFDAAFFKNALSISADYFRKTTSDILLTPLIPTVFGTTLPNFNSGELKTNGWDLTLNYRLHKGRFNHNFGFNLGDTWNEVTKFEGHEQIKRTEEYYTIIREGLPFNSLYGYKTNGVFQSYEEIASSAVPVGYAVQPGDLKFIDRNGDGVIDSKDRYVIGNSFPRFTFGFNYNLNYKGFDLGLLIQGVGKRDQAIRGELLEPFHANYSYVMYEHQLDYWTPTNINARYPRIAASGSASNENNYKMGSDLNVLDGKYLRLKNIQLGYTLPVKISNRMGMQKTRIYVNGQNLLTLSKNSFIDPESSEFNSNMSNGSGANSGRSYPLLKYYGFGIDFQF
ncbi:SusC/RagA family TonB-linked outer membrane protein [Pseudopedobacter beijingensis]|uniref:SusC/RagA family TonB-linked outer membrane protein n=1 Tax=Pseudopedobacter beijingensis TaxID=1207056 RepID=A0ABW4IFP2_9SPHI